MLSVEAAARRGDFRLEAAFEVGHGVTALFGPSGAGKSTLFAIVAGLLRAERARITLAGRRIDGLAPDRRGLGVVFQDARLFPHLSVRANLSYGLRRRGGPLALGEVLDLLDLTEFADRRPATLSGGEARRVALGRALLSGPGMLLLDEPFAGVDIARKDRLIGYLERLRDRSSLPMLYVSHDTDEVLRLADETVLLRAGRVVAAGTTEEVFSRFDLRGAVGGDSGAAVAATVAGHDPAYGLTALRVGTGTFHVPRLDAPAGSRVRLRVRARDVALFLRPPEGSSMLNRFAGRIVGIERGADGQVDVALDVGVPLWARITARSADDLGLAVGQEIHAAVKTAAIDRRPTAGPAP